MFFALRAGSSTVARNIRFVLCSSQPGARNRYSQDATSDRHIAVAVRAFRMRASARPGANRRSAPCLLSAQGDPSLSRGWQQRFLATHFPRRQLLPWGLLPRRHQRPVGASAASPGVFLITRLNSAIKPLRSCKSGRRLRWSSFFPRSSCLLQLDLSQSRIERNAPAPDMQ